MKMLTEAITMLDERCIKGITANREHCLTQLEGSIGTITALTPYIGYENGTRIAQQALESGKSIKELVLAEGLLDENTLEIALKLEGMLNL